MSATASSSSSVSIPGSSSGAALTPPGGDSSIASLQAISHEITAVEAKIGIVEADILKAEGNIETAKNGDDLQYWREEKKQLREKEGLLREEKKHLREKEGQLREDLRDEKKQQQLAAAAGAAAIAATELASYSTVAEEVFDSVRRFHQRFCSLPQLCEDSLSNPSIVTDIPFLWVDDVDIPERVKLQQASAAGQSLQCLQFMGRTRMKELLLMIRSLTTGRLENWKLEQEASQSSSSTAATRVAPHSLTPFATQAIQLLTKLLVYGSPGWGKSYMMAAAAVVLKQNFLTKATPLRVIYLPDCGKLRARPVDYMKKALLLAFAEDEQRLQLISACCKTDDLVNFCDNVPRSNSFLLFIADQTNKLTTKPNAHPKYDAAKEAKKAIALELLVQASFKHFLVDAISINDSNREDVAQKQENRKELAMFGEISDTEWEAWLARHHDRLPSDSAEDGSSPGDVVAKIAAETGRNMLFLSPFVRPDSVSVAEWTFDAAWKAFLRLKEVSKIQPNLLAFVNPVMNPHRDIKSSLSCMVSCICNGSLVDQPWFYDARYFCVLDGIGHTVGQYVSRCAALAIESQGRLDLFREGIWINSIREHRNNPSVTGFLVEKAVLGYLSTMDVMCRILQRPDLHNQRVEVKTFKHGTEASSLSSSNVVTLYIPEEFNYKAVDAVIRIIDRVHEKPVSQPSRKSSRKRAKRETATVDSSSAPSSAMIVAASSHHEMSSEDVLAEDEEERIAVDVATNIASSSSRRSSSVSESHVSSTTTTTVTIFPVQITITPSISQLKRDKSFRFFQRRAAWCSDFKDEPNVRVEHRFAFIGRQCVMQAPQSVAIDHEGKEQFQLSFIPLSSINPQLDRAVDSPPAAAGAALQNVSPPRFHLTAAAAAASLPPNDQVATETATDLNTMSC